MSTPKSQQEDHQSTPVNTERDNVVIIMFDPSIFDVNKREDKGESRTPPA